LSPDGSDAARRDPAGVRFGQGKARHVRDPLSTRAGAQRGLVDQLIRLGDAVRAVREQRQLVAADQVPQKALLECGRLSIEASAAPIAVRLTVIYLHARHSHPPFER
jgi:hypothetical protein